MARQSENPFRIGSQVTGEFFTDRAPEVKRIAAALREPTRLIVFGPRRIGKSSAIGVATNRVRKDGTLVVRADLSTASGLVDVANRLLHSLSTQRLRDRLAEFASSIAPSVSLTFDGVTGVPRIVFGTEQRTLSEERQRRSLEQVIEGLAAQVGKGERHVAIVLDEFQAIRRFGGEAAEWHLRDLIQRHGQLSFVCAGSEVSLIQSMLGPERAFFRMFEMLHMGPVEPEHLSRWIDSRLEGAGVKSSKIGAAIVGRIGPRTQDVLQVARHVYARGIASGVAGEESVEAAVVDVVREEDTVIRSIWLNLTTQQQNVLRAVASGSAQIFSAAARERFGLPSSSSVSAAVDALEARGILARDSETAAVAFDSPFVRVWVEREALQDVPPLT
jgi:uncharacterized protein